MCGGHTRSLQSGRAFTFMHTLFSGSGFESSSLFVLFLCEVHTLYGLTFSHILFFFHEATFTLQILSLCDTRFILIFSHACCIIISFCTLTDFHRYVGPNNICEVCNEVEVAVHTGQRWSIGILYYSHIII